MQIVRDLREKNAVFGIMAEELAVGVDVLECEMSSRPLEVLASRERIADAREQGNRGWENQRGVDPDDGTSSHFGHVSDLTSLVPIEYSEPGC